MVFQCCKHAYIIVHINEKMTHYHTVNLHIKNVFRTGKYILTAKNL